MTQDEGTRAHVLPQSLSGSSYFGHRAWARQQARFRLQWKLRAGGGRIVVCQAAFSQCDETSVATFEAVSR